MLDPDTGERFQRLRRELGVQSFGINLLTLQPGQRSRVHVHERQEEVYLVLEGELTLLFDDGESVLEPERAGPRAGSGTSPAGQPRPGRVVLIALGGAGEHESRDALAWGDWDESGPGKGPADVPLPDDLDVT